MKNNFIKILFVIFTAIGMLGFSGQAKAVDPLVVEFQGGSPPLFNEANLAPGSSVTHWVKVTNNSGSTQRIAIEAINFTKPVPETDLSRALMILIKQGATEIYGGAGSEKTLYQFYQNGETYLSELTNGNTVQYDITISLPSDRGDAWQEKTTGFFDVTVGFEGTEGGLPLPSPGGGTGGGGGGGWLPPGLTIQNETVNTVTETSVTITWLTSYAATSQVIYAKDGEFHTLCLTETEGCALGTPPPPKYGYARTTLESDTSPKVTNHSVTISGLNPATTYYYRTVSHGSLAISGEQSFTTLMPGGEVAGASTGRKGKIGSGLAQGGGIIGGASTGTGELSPSPSVSPEPENQAGQRGLFATIGSVITFGTGNAWLGILVVLILIVVVYYLVKAISRRSKKETPA